MNDIKIRTPAPIWRADAVSHSSKMATNTASAEVGPPRPYTAPLLGGARISPSTGWALFDLRSAYDGGSSWGIIGGEEVDDGADTSDETKHTSK
jgi:hypothetical protein